MQRPAEFSGPGEGFSPPATTHELELALSNLAHAAREHRILVSELQPSVRDLVAALKNAGTPPEKVVVAVKRAVKASSLDWRADEETPPSFDVVTNETLAWTIIELYGRR
jgi:hypothetical protein